MTIIPDAFADFMRLLRGEEGEAWLTQLPTLLATCAELWDMVIDPTPFPNLSYNYVAPATCADGRAAVVKIGMPNRELLTEMAAMRLYNGQGTADLLGVAEDLGALLLAQVQPGTPLTAVSTQDDEQATRIMASLVRQLHRPVPDDHPFPTLADWMGELAHIRPHFGGSTGPIPERWVDRAQGIAGELLASAKTAVLLHGDLHHDNILADEATGWLVIDPKGVIGDPAYETARFLHNPINPSFVKRPLAQQQLARRVDILMEMLGFERERIVGWGFCDVMVGMWWSAEDGDSRGLAYGVACAELLAELISSHNHL